MKQPIYFFTVFIVQCSTTALFTKHKLLFYCFHFCPLFSNLSLFLKSIYINKALSTMAFNVLPSFTFSYSSFLKTFWLIYTGLLIIILYANIRNYNIKIYIFIQFLLKPLIILK